MRDRTEFGGVILAVLILSFGGALLTAALIGLWAWLLVGVITIAVFATAIVLWSRRHKHPVAWAVPEPLDDGTRRIVVIADETCDPAVLRAAIPSPAKVLVIAPALSSRRDSWTNDERAYVDARARLDATLATLAGEGMDIDGRVGAHDPLQAADDGLRELTADELIFASGPEGSENWLATGAVEAARSRYAIPVREVGR